MATHSPFKLVSDAPSVELLLERAKALAPAIAARRADADARRDVPGETIEALREAGLLRALQPARWGGLELDPRAVLDLQNVFAEACPSTAWVYGVLSVQAFLLARFDPRAQGDVWGSDPDALISSSFQPVGQVAEADGGFTLSGRFSFSSGSSHCGWALLGGMLPPGPSRPAPEMRLFLVPRADYAIDDVWHVIGLKGTGSNDIVVENAFVPAHRTYSPDSGLLPLPASSGLPALYRLPWMYLFTSMISNLGTGAARGALAVFVEATRSRTSVAGVPARENPTYLGAIARTAAAIEAEELLARHNLGRLIEAVAEDREVPLGEATLYRAQLTSAMRRMAALVDELQLLLGARGIRSDNVLARTWLDLAAARAHAGNDPAATFGQLGRELLG